MASLALKDLWRDIVWCPTNSSLALAIEVNLRSEPEIPHFNLHLFIDKEVAKFQISVNNAVLVQILQSIHDLQCVALHLEFVQSFPALEQVVQRLILANFQQDVNIFRVLEEMLELADVLVLETPVNFDFTH